jgi:hypothetical protein
MPIKSLKNFSLLLALAVLIINIPAFGQVGIQSVEGIFEHQVSCDFNHGLEKQHYYLKDTTTNKVRKLVFPNKPPSSLKTGSRVRLTGNVSASQIEVTENGMAAMQFEAADIVESAVTGDRKMLVFLANFITPNGTVNLSCSNAQIKDTFFDNPSSINKYYQAASFHDPARNSFGVSFSGTVVGPYNIQYNPTTCDTNSIASLLKTAAQNAGVNISNYNHYVYLYPYVDACSFAGLGTVGGN